MTAIAACIEGFWSARDIDPALKYSVGITGWVLHLLYFTLMGRRLRAA